jgi:hypothetical protein
VEQPPAASGMRRGHVIRVVLLALALVWTQLPGGRGARAEGDRALQICCAWGRSLADGNLTYSMVGNDPVTLDVMRGAVRAWDDALTPITLTEVPPDRKPDIVIQFRGATGAGLGGTESSGGTQGEAVTTFTRRGLIHHVDVTVDGPPAPANAGGIEQITKHEVGHALGVGHVNFDGDIMSPIVNPQSSPLSGCDLNGVVEANRWQTMEGRPAARPPSATQIAC